ncbi:MAG TPA: hypothetical protein VFZ00_31470 [Solirubrobacter sp.]|nr:hypothetical protein [Solirubrobacter sp.]
MSAILFVVGAAGVARPAEAASPVNQSYRVNTSGESSTRGYARARGDLTWYSRRKFIISGRINDICPRDGRGAFLFIEINYRDGDRSNHYPRRARDMGGCRDRNGEAFSITYRRHRRITYVGIWACEGTPTRPQACRGKTRDNPFTRGRKRN